MTGGHANFVVGQMIIGEIQVTGDKWLREQIKIPSGQMTGEHKKSSGGKFTITDFNYKVVIYYKDNECSWLQRSVYWGYRSNINPSFSGIGSDKNINASNLTESNLQCKHFRVLLNCPWKRSTIIESFKFLWICHASSATSLSGRPLAS